MFCTSDCALESHILWNTTSKPFSHPSQWGSFSRNNYADSSLMKEQPMNQENHFFLQKPASNHHPGQNVAQLYPVSENFTSPFLLTHPR